MELLLLLVLLATWIGLACGVGVIAAQRGKDRGTWTLIAILVSPLIAILFLIAAPVSTHSASDTPTEGHRVKCTECAELILPEAKVCRFCGAKRESQLIRIPIYRTSTGRTSIH
jgi:hypothetical protein